MLTTERQRVQEELERIADEYGRERTALIPMLQEVQRRYSQISPHAMQVIADLVGIHPVEVHSVVSFYSFLGEEKKGKFTIRLCRTISCDLEGKDQIARQLEADLGISFGETTDDGMFSLEWANCMGMCDQGPALLVNERIYTRVRPGMIHEIIEECRGLFGLHATHHKEEHLV